MKVVVFTNRSSHGAALLGAMKEHGIPVSAVFIQRPPSRTPLGKLKRAWRLGLGYTAGVLRKRVRSLFDRRPQPASLPDRFYLDYTSDLHEFRSFNSKECRERLAQIQPDVIVLGGARIIRKPVIRIPTVGVLNAHPGLLPHYRGVDVVAWAALNGDPVGVTVHFVDEGVDTGGILVRRTVPVEPGDDLDALRTKAEHLAGQLMAETLLKVQRGETLRVVPQAREDGKQHYRMPAYLKRQVERKLRKMSDGTGRAHIHDGSPL